MNDLLSEPVIRQVEMRFPEVTSTTLPAYAVEIKLAATGRARPQASISETGKNLPQPW